MADNGDLFVAERLALLHRITHVRAACIYGRNEPGHLTGQL